MEYLLEKNDHQKTHYQPFRTNQKLYSGTPPNGERTCEKREVFLIPSFVEMIKSQRKSLLDFLNILKK